MITVQQRRDAVADAMNAYKRILESGAGRRHLGEARDLVNAVTNRGQLVDVRAALRTLQNRADALTERPA